VLDGDVVAHVEGDGGEVGGQDHEPGTVGSVEIGCPTSAGEGRRRPKTGDQYAE
jgi:hypothetical protein